MPAERKTRDEVLRLVRDGRAELDAALARIPEERTEEPLLDGGWSAKDLMAHVTHWEMAFLGNLGEPPPPVLNQGGADATNRAVYEHHRARRLADVRREFEETHRRLVERVSQFDDDGLNAKPMPDQDRVVWQYVAGETWEHYPEHVAQLEQARL
jgi:uncharacterized damage-inducible protein DinB